MLVLFFIALCTSSLLHKRKLLWKHVLCACCNHKLDWAPVLSNEIVLLKAPQDDGGNQEVEARRFVDLMLIAAIAHFTELVEEDPAREGVSGFSSG